MLSGATCGGTPCGALVAWIGVTERNKSTSKIVIKCFGRLVRRSWNERMHSASLLRSLRLTMVIYGRICQIEWFRSPKCQQNILYYRTLKGLYCNGLVSFLCLFFSIGFFFFNTFNVVWGWGPEHVCDLSPDLRAQPVS